MDGQGATAKYIAAIIAQVTPAMSKARGEEEDNEIFYMVHQAELENAKCSSDDGEDDESLYMEELENAKYS